MAIFQFSNYLNFSLVVEHQNQKYYLKNPRNLDLAESQTLKVAVVVDVDSRIHDVDGQDFKIYF